MKTKASLLVFAAVALATTGCVNWNSFNATNPPQSAGAPGTAATAKPAPASAAKAKPTPVPGKKPPKVQPSQTSNAPAAGQTSSAQQSSPAPAASSSASTAGGTAAPSSNQGAASSTPTASVPAPTPQPTPASRVIKEETSSKVEVISSRPVVGTDAEMGN